MLNGWYDSLEGTGKRGVGTIDVLYHVSWFYGGKGGVLGWLILPAIGWVYCNYWKLLYCYLFIHFFIHFFIYSFFFFLLVFLFIFDFLYFVTNVLLIIFCCCWLCDSVVTCVVW